MLIKKVLDDSLKIHLKTALVLNYSIIKFEKTATLTKKLIFIKKVLTNYTQYVIFLLDRKEDCYVNKLRQVFTHIPYSTG